jgi:hypothetical protein
MLELHIGRRLTDVSLHPDGGLWRIHQAGRVSDIVNLPRAKEAGISWARPRGLGATEVARWHHRETPAEALYSVFSPGLVPDSQTLTENA